MSPTATAVPNVMVPAATAAPNLGANNDVVASLAAKALVILGTVAAAEAMTSLCEMLGAAVAALPELPPVRDVPHGKSAISYNTFMALTRRQMQTKRRVKVLSALSLT